MREQVANLEVVGLRSHRLERPTDLGRRVGLHIERVELARRAEVKDHDDRALVVPFGNGALCLSRQELRQTQANCPERADLEKVTPGYPVASLRRTTSREREHENVLL